MANADTRMLDWLEEQNRKEINSGRCVFRWSKLGRGWRLHETGGEHSFLSVREAIAWAMEHQDDTNLCEEKQDG